MSKPKISPIPVSLNQLHEFDKFDNIFAKQGSNFTMAQVVDAQANLAQVDASQAEPEQAKLAQGSAVQAKPKRAKLVQAEATQVEPEKPVGKAFMYGQKNRLMAYVTPEMADKVVKLAAELERSESWVAGKLITEALQAREKG